MDPDEFLERLMRSMRPTMETEFARLEPCAVTPTVGDRVLVAAGFLGMGHLWVREEAVVEECGDTSYKVRFVHYKSYTSDEPVVMWVHQNLITDVLKDVKVAA